MNRPDRAMTNLIPEVPSSINEEKGTDPSLCEEQTYLDKTLKILKNEASEKIESLPEHEKNIILMREEMWERSRTSQDSAEMLQYLMESGRQLGTYLANKTHITRLTKMLDSPYFGRLDFQEEGTSIKEKIYIGKHNLTDSKTRRIYIYDWRTPIASMFYRYEPGKASFEAPIGQISGEVSLKRQYKIKSSHLKYFFDCSVRINDEILQEALSQNTSEKMKSIIETIQKEQDQIIRDTTNQLLIVQGVAGSGKTSVALHRIAYLLYEGLDLKLDSNEIVIISPNEIFSDYISDVLPELGEDNVKQITIRDIFARHFEELPGYKTRNSALEELILFKNQPKSQLIKKSLEFKGSHAFSVILDRFLIFYERKMINFRDVYFHGKVMANKEELKSFFLDNKIGMPMSKRLKRIEGRILNSIQELQEKRLQKIQDIVKLKPEHEFEADSLSRLLSIKLTKRFTDQIHDFTEINAIDLYKLLFSNHGLFMKMAAGIELPECIEEIINETLNSLENETIAFEDTTPLLYLKIKTEGTPYYSDIKQVVIDEAQDYYPLDYKVFELLFNNAKFTVLGDVNQTIERALDFSFYDEVEKTLNKKYSQKLFLNKSYRASYEINKFALQIQNTNQDFVSFVRRETEPEIIQMETVEEISSRLVNDAKGFMDEGFESIAILCSTQQQAENLHAVINKLSRKENIEIMLFDENYEYKKGVTLMPVYMAKGLEFDVVLIYSDNFGKQPSELDRRLLYIACTRALHRLNLYTLSTSEH